MHKKLLASLLLIILALTLVALPACQGEPEATPAPTAMPAPTATPAPGETPSLEPSPSPTAVPPAGPSSAFGELSGQISGINPSNPSSLADILGALKDLEKAGSRGNVSGTEAKELDGELKDKFASWTRNTVDSIDPAKPESLKDFFDLQAVQGLTEYDENVDPETKEYKEEQMADKFNQWVRNRIDEIDPENQDALKAMFDLQVIQQTDKYEELTTADTHNYKEAQMADKFNQWVRNRVDEIDPADPDNLKYFFWLQTVQATEKYDEFATPQTHEYKEQQMKQKFNEWVENRVNELDPNDPDYLEDLEKLRVIQLSDKYERFIVAPVHDWKERMLKDKMDIFVGKLVDGLDPALPDFWKDLAELAGFQLTEVYQEFCSAGTKEYKQTRLNEMFAVPFGTPPMVEGAYPLNWQTDVPLDQPILIVFNQVIQATSLKTAINITPVVPFEIIPLTEEGVYLAKPGKLLSGDTEYNVRVATTAISMRGQTLLEEYEFSFTTEEAGQAPQILSVMPQDGTVDNLAGQPVSIVFDRSMLTDSVESAISITPAFDYSFYWSDDDTTVTLQSHEPLDYNTEFTVDIDTTAMSADGLPLEEDYRFGFTTAIMNYPRVLGSMPESGQTITANHPIQIVFDRSMNKESVESRISISNPGFQYNANWLEADMVLRIEPLATLPPETTYKVSLDPGAVSSFGLPLEDSYAFTFTTR